MEKRPLLATFCFVIFFTTLSFSQTSMSVEAAKKESGTAKSPSLKPADGVPAKFSSKEEMENAVPQKTAKIMEMIISGQYSGDRLRILREELWRFENAIVVKP